MIETQDLGKRFGSFQAVDGVNLRVKAGQVLALLGPNGAGKTTTVRMLTSILVPSRGWARVAGFDIVRQASKVRASVGVLTEQHGLYNRMPADEYLDFFGQVYSLDLPTRRARAERLLQKFGLYEDRRRLVGEYSKGMRQKLALARSLLHEPPVLLLDEPTSAMDPEASRLVHDSIRDLRSSERAIILCTHNLAEAEELADAIAIIRRGKIIAQGTVNELKLQLLGPPEYEVRLAAPASDAAIPLPAGVALVARGPDWLRCRIENPRHDNPALLRALLDQGLPILSLQEAPRSLEQVYLQAIQAPDQEEFHAV